MQVSRGRFNTYVIIQWKAIIVWPSYLWSLLLTTNSKFEADAESIIAVCSLPLKLTLRDLAAYTEFWMNSKYFSKAAAAAKQ